MAGPIEQLIASQQGPNPLGAIGNAAQILSAIQATKMAPLQLQQEQQRIDMGKAQLAALGQQQEQAKRAQLLQIGANASLAIKRAPAEQRPAMYAQALQQASQMGYDVSQLPSQYNEQAQRVLDWSEQQVYGAERFKTDEEIRKEQAKPGRYKLEQTTNGFAIYDSTSPDKPMLYTDPAKAAKAFADLLKTQADTEKSKAETAKTTAETGTIPLNQEKISADIEKINAETAKTKQETAGGGKQTDTEKQAAGYFDRMQKAEAALTAITSNGFNPITSWEALKGNTNVTASKDKQLYQQAANDWIRAKLRKESGAVIGAQEMKDEYKTYFPVYGDSAEVIAQKALARRTATAAMQGMASPQNTVPAAVSAPSGASTIDDLVKKYAD